MGRDQSDVVLGPPSTGETLNFDPTLITALVF